MKVPLKTAAIGLLLGIGLTMFFEVETAEGTALLTIVCTLLAMVLTWLVQLIVSRKEQP